MPKVSVIIPVYNVENYLQKCLDSVINQSLKDIEIICINDGSTDSSLNILKSYASQDNRIIIIDKPNEGQGIARNLGIDKAKGDYISFIDPDDYIELDMYEKMINQAKNLNSDIVICDLIKVDEKTKQSKDFNFFIEAKTVIKTKKIKVVPNKNISRDIIDKTLLVSPCYSWNKIYKTSLLKDNKIYFSNRRIYEDCIFILKSHILAQNISYINKAFYNYFIRKTSTIRSSSSKLNEIIKTIKEIKTYLKEENLLDKYIKNIEWLVCANTKWHYFASSKEDKQKHRFALKQEIRKSSYVKLMYILLKKELLHNNFLLKTIFSITNNRNKTHKIITILGFKLKVSIKNHLKQWQKSLQKKQAKTTQDTYVLFDSLSDASIECIDAYSLFCYMKANNYKAYYIMLKDNRLYNNLKINNKLENIIALEKPIKQDENAFKHALNHILIKTKAVITSFGESAGYNRFFKSNPYWQYVFIQHGQTSLKQSVMNNNYIYPEKFDKFLISSENERNIFLNSGFKDDKFIKVGLPRWDLLNTNHNLKEKSILFMFTWRKLDQQKFEKSMYKKNLLSLLHNQQLLDYLKNNNIKLYFAPHHALKNNSDIDFDAINSNIEEIPSTKISEAIKNCSMLVTDFSSVVFDFMFQDKPVICYGLDLGDKILSRNEQKDLKLLQDKQETFPNIIFSEQDVINKIKYYVENNFNVEAENLNKYSKYFYTKENIRQKIAKALENL